MDKKSSLQIVVALLGSLSPMMAAADGSSENLNDLLVRREELIRSIEQLLGVRKVQGSQKLNSNPLETEQGGGASVSPVVSLQLQGVPQPPLLPPQFHPEIQGDQSDSATFNSNSPGSGVAYIDSISSGDFKLKHTNVNESRSVQSNMAPEASRVDFNRQIVEGRAMLKKTDLSKNSPKQSQLEPGQGIAHVSHVSSQPGMPPPPSPRNVNEIPPPPPLILGTQRGQLAPQLRQNEPVSGQNLQLGMPPPPPPPPPALDIPRGRSAHQLRQNELVSSPMPHVDYMDELKNGDTRSKLRKVDPNAPKPKLEAKNDVTSMLRNAMAIRRADLTYSTNANEPDSDWDND